MKKLLLLVCIFSSSIAFAQDLNINLVSPSTGTTLTNGQAFNFTVSVGNAGTSDIVAGDSIIIGLYMDNVIMTNEAGQNLLFLYKPSINISNGQSLNVSLQGGVKAKITETKTGANFCVTGVISKVGFVDPNTTNNTSCLIVNTSSGTTGINQDNFTLTELFAYPNPANNFITVNHNMLENSGTIVVLDITGKIISKTKLTKDQTNINLDTFTSGVYIYQVIDSSNKLIKSDKFIVTK